MKSHRALLISILINLSLLGWIISMNVKFRRQVNRSPKDNVESHDTTGERLEAIHRFVPQPIILTNLLTPFDWRQVESTNYKQYIYNLRAIGCPELTIREIVTADVNDLFSARRATLTKTNRYEYWRGTPVNLSDEQRKQLDELSFEQCEVLRALGIEPSSTDLYAFQYRGNYATKHLKQLEFLPDAERERLEDLLLRIDQQKVIVGDDQVRLAELRVQSQSAIRSLLTPDEFHEYELRNSIPATQLRVALKELQPTEQEFRTIFDHWTSVNEYEWGSPAYREAQQSSEAALRSLLGPRRFELYLKGVEGLGYSK